MAGESDVDGVYDLRQRFDPSVTLLGIKKKLTERVQVLLHLQVSARHRDRRHGRKF